MAAHLSSLQGQRLKRKALGALKRARLLLQPLTPKNRVAEYSRF